MDHLIREKTKKINSRLGFHYFLDSERFQDTDAEFWVNILHKFNTKWLVIKNPKNRAVPEEFIRRIEKNNINIVLDLNQDLKNNTDFAGIRTLIEVYGKWGVKYAYLYQKPNSFTSWTEKDWDSLDIVKEHFKKFYRFADICIANNVKPIFSPLYPGGNYWDLAFLEKSLSLISLNCSQAVVRNLILSAYGWDWGHSINWGAGGKSKWPAAGPFSKNKDTQNQQGFRTYQWYLEISEKILGQKPPIIILEAGKPGEPISNFLNTAENYAPKVKIISRLLSGVNVYSPHDSNHLLASIPKEVIACTFFILSADHESDLLPYRWFAADGSPLKPAQIITNKNLSVFGKNNGSNKSIKNNGNSTVQFKYNRYLFISKPLRRQMPTLLEKLDPYIRKYRPHIGFSLLEASNAAYVLIIANDKEAFLKESADILPDKSVVKIISENEINSAPQKVKI
ncbi:MAG: hypothetical protein J7L66_01235 [Anaerolineaceae bacterium]|nr:hypothetical protein [Anaerolineaceae bacterium]